MSKNQIIIALVVLTLVGTIWGSVQDKKSKSLERQLAALKADPPASPAVDEAVASDAQAVVNKALTEIADLKSQNKALLADAETLRSSVASQQKEIASLKKQLAEASSGSQTIGAMQAQLDKGAAEITKLQEALTAAKAEVAQKTAALAAAEEVAAGLEGVKSVLANSVDAYSAKSQELSAEVEEYHLRIQSLEKALEERTKSLVAAGEELARTKLNMNVLLSKIAAQNNSLEILEETRVALEKELAMKFLTIEDLQRQLSIKVVSEDVSTEEPVTEEDQAAPAEEVQQAVEESSAAH